MLFTHHILQRIFTEGQRGILATNTHGVLLGPKLNEHRDPNGIVQQMMYFVLAIYTPYIPYTLYQLYQQYTKLTALTLLQKKSLQMYSLLVCIIFQHCINKFSFFCIQRDIQSVILFKYQYFIPIRKSYTIRLTLNLLSYHYINRYLLIRA